MSKPVIHLLHVLLRILAYVTTRTQESVSEKKSEFLGIVNPFILAFKSGLKQFTCTRLMCVYSLRPLMTNALPMFFNF